jgi:hypothetical protein
VFTSSVDSFIQIYADDHDTAKFFYDWILLQYTPRSEVKLQQLYDEFGMISLTKFNDMQDYIDKNKRAYRQIQGVGGIIDLEYQKARFINDLISEYAFFKSIFHMLANNEKDIFDKVCYLLLNEEYQHKNIKRMAKKSNINIAYVLYANHTISNNESISKRIRCKTCQCFYKGICFVEIGEIPPY